MSFFKLNVISYESVSFHKEKGTQAWPCDRSCIARKWSADAIVAIHHVHKAHQSFNCDFNNLISVVWGFLVCLLFFFLFVCCMGNTQDIRIKEGYLTLKYSFGAVFSVRSNIFRPSPSCVY